MDTRGASDQRTLGPKPGPTGSQRGASLRAVSAAVSGLVVLAVTACASSDPDTQLPAPVMITEQQHVASCVIGETVVIVIPEDEITETVVDSSDPGLIDISQSFRDESASFNAGGECLAPGVATLTVHSPDGSTREITLTISE